MKRKKSYIDDHLQEIVYIQSMYSAWKVNKTRIGGDADEKARWPLHVGGTDVEGSLGWCCMLASSQLPLQANIHLPKIEG
jgi:hypothetical protein